jgi:hypothetical protein
MYLYSNDFHFGIKKLNNYSLEHNIDSFNLFDNKGNNRFTNIKKFTTY